MKKAWKHIKKCIMPQFERWMKNSGNFFETLLKLSPPGKNAPIKKYSYLFMERSRGEFSHFFRDVDMKFKWIFLFIILLFFRTSSFLHFPPSHGDNFPLSRKERKTFHTFKDEISMNGSFIKVEKNLLLDVGRNSICFHQENAMKLLHKSVWKKFFLTIKI